MNMHKKSVVHRAVLSDDTGEISELTTVFLSQSTRQERVDLYAYLARKFLLRARPGLKVRNA